MDNLDKIIAVLEDIKKRATYEDFKVLTADYTDATNGFYMSVPSGGGTVIGVTFKGTSFSTTFLAGDFPCKLRSITFTGSVAGIKIYIPIS